MQGFTIKSYPDSYLYNIDPSGKGREVAKLNNNALKEYILSATRITDKTSGAFLGVFEGLKRSQKSSVLVSVLMMDQVQLCIGKFELPKAFKVFDAKDPKNNKQNRIFIDLTGLVEFKDGYYTCKRFDVLTAYLMDALVYLLYRWSPEKLINNSNIISTATNNYISMFTYILDYVRVANFRENKNKISYFIGLYFIHNMMGLPIDDYSRRIAAKAAELSVGDIRGFDLYVDDDTFTNINTFLGWLIKTFKLNGLTLRIFVQKWAYNYGTGSEYATELFSSFLVLMMNAFSGSYIVNQRQIERCCGMVNLVKLWNAIEMAGKSKYDNRGFMSESNLKDFEIHDGITLERKAMMESRNDVPIGELFTESDFYHKDELGNKCKNIKDKYKKAGFETKIGLVAEQCISAGILALYNEAMNIAVENGADPVYESGSLEVSINNFKKNLDDRQVHVLETTLNRDIEALRESVSKYNCSKENAQKISNIVNEMINCKNLL